MGNSDQLALMQSAMEEGRWEDLKKQADQYSLDYPSEIEGYLYGGRANLALEDYAEATYHFTMANRMDAKNPEALLALAKLGLLQNQMSIARHNFRELLKLDANNADALSGLGDAAYHEQDYKGALDYYHQLKSNPNWSSLSADQQEVLLYKMADAYQLLGLLEEGLAFIAENRPDHFSESLTLVERDLYRLQFAAQNSADLETKIFECTKALYEKVDPRKARYVVEYAQLLNAKQEYDQVEGLYTELLGMDLEEATRAEALYERASLRKKQQNYQAAVEDYTQLIELDARWYYYTDRAEVYIQLKNAKAALADYNTAIELQERPVYNTIKGRAGLYQKAKVFDKAIEDGKRLVKLEGDNPDGYLVLAEALRAKKEMEKAFKMYLEAELRGSLKARDLLATHFAKQVGQMRSRSTAKLLDNFKAEFSRNEQSPILQKAFGKLWVPDMNKFILAMGDEALKYPAAALERVLDEIAQDLFIITPQGLLFYEGTEEPMEAFYRVEVESEHAILLEIQPTKGGPTENMRISYYEDSLLLTYPVQTEEVPAKYFYAAEEISDEQKKRLTEKKYNNDYLEAIEASIAELIN
jgi:tetratricopeptide (TPR) repeat protein